MHWSRRWNEGNVDLNRNALKVGEPFEGLAERRRELGTSGKGWPPAPLLRPDA